MVLYQDSFCLHHELLTYFGSTKESQLKHVFEPQQGLFLCESPHVILRAMDAGYTVHAILMENRFLNDFQLKVPEYDENDFHHALHRILTLLAPEIPVFCTDLSEISKICGFRQSRGFIALMNRIPSHGLEAVLKDSQTVAVLEDVENPSNIGAFFRSATALGVDGIILGPGCSDPLYRRSSRVSMGAVFQVKWTRFDGALPVWLDFVFNTLAAYGYTSMGFALNSQSVSLDDPALKRHEKKALFFGNEEKGLMEETIQRCDYRVMIPMQHGVDSLNVAASSAIAFWELTKGCFPIMKGDV